MRSSLPLPYSSPVLAVVLLAVIICLVSILINLFLQLLPRRRSEPPLVLHWLPFIGNAISYGLDPLGFYTRCRDKHGDIFTFVLLGRRMTVYLGTEGNEFILNGKLQDVNAEEIYAPLTTPVFGSDIIYDCPNAKLMEQKRFVKFGLTHASLCSYVELIEKEVRDYLDTAPAFRGQSGVVDIPAVMAEITIFTASRTLQGQAVRDRLTTDFAELYHDLDLGFRPINFLMPWAPLPQNRRRDNAHAKMRSIYLDIIDQRRASGKKPSGEDVDMIWHLMGCQYKNGQPVPDKEIAHMMITLLMAGQHSSSSASSWIMLRLASQPEIADDLLQEQIKVLGSDASQPLRYSDMDKLPLLQSVVKETLRVHSSIHSLMRKVMRPIEVPNTDYVITPGKILVSSPMMSHMTEQHFPNAKSWDPHRWDGMPLGETQDDMIDYGYGAVSKGTKSPYLPFGAGRHRCIGEKFAYINLCTIVSTLVRSMTFRTLDGKRTVPPTDYTSLFSRPVQPAYVRWERRRAPKTL